MKRRIVLGAVLGLILYSLGFLASWVVLKQPIVVEEVVNYGVTTVSVNCNITIDTVSTYLLETEDGEVFIQNKLPEAWFGIVRDTGSMEPTLSGGNLILIEGVDNLEELNVGDILVFKNPEVSWEVVAHRIVQIEYDKGGWFAYTKGDSNSMEDLWKVRFEDVLGVCTGVYR